MLAILAYLGILIIIPFVTEAKNDPFVKFHLKQGLTLIIVEAIGYVLAMIPVLGWILYFVLWIFAIVMTVTGIVNVVTGKQKELPIIGKYASKLNF
jgi:uncharacterized membrane protein